VETIGTSIGDYWNKQWKLLELALETIGTNFKRLLELTLETIATNVGDYWNKH